MAIEYKDIIRLEGTTLTLPSTCKAGQVGFETDGTKRMRREMVVDGVVLHWTSDEYQTAELISYSSEVNPQLTNVKLALDHIINNINIGNDVITNNDFIFGNNYGSLRLDNNEASIIMSADGSVNLNASSLQVNTPVDFNSSVNFDTTVGFGTTPSPWQTGYHALEFGKYGEIFANDTDSTVTIATNCYLNSSDEWIAKETAHSSRLVVGPDNVAIYLNQALTAGTEFFPDDDHRLILFDHEGRVTVKKSYIVDHDLESNNDDFGGWFANYNGYAGMGVFRNNDLVLRGGAATVFKIDGTTGKIGITTDAQINGNLTVNGTFSGNTSFNTLIINNNVGIGTTNPQVPLHVIGDTIIDGDLTVTGNSVEIPLSFTDTVFINQSNDRAALSVNQNDSGNSATVMEITNEGTGHALVIGNGNAGIGTSNPTQKLDVNGNVILRNEVYCVGIGTEPDGTTYNIEVDLNGKFVRDVSSIRYKENVRYEVDTEWLQDVKVCMYDKKSGVKNEIGIIAEELYAIAPDYIFYNKDGQIDGYNKVHLIPVLINEIQKQNKKIKQQNEIISNILERLEKNCI